MKLYAVLDCDDAGGVMFFTDEVEAIETKNELALADVETFMDEKEVELTPEGMLALAEWAAQLAS